MYFHSYMCFYFGVHRQLLFKYMCFHHFIFSVVRKTVTRIPVLAEQGCQTGDSRRQKLKKKYKEIGLLKVYTYFYEKYPKFKKFAALIRRNFGSIYLCEQSFYCRKGNKTAHGSKLINVNLSSIMKVVSS